MFSNRNLLVLLFAAVLGVGCIRESELCPPPDDGGETKTDASTLKVMLVHPDIDIDLRDKTFDKAVLFVFDKNDAMIDTIQLRRPVTIDRVIDTKYALDPKEYHFVAWVANNGVYSVATAQKRAEAAMKFEVPADGRLAEPLEFLLYGDTNYIVEDEYKDEVVQIPLVLDNYVVNITATGLENATRVDDPAIAVKDQVPTYDFSNNHTDGDDFLYNVPTTADGNTLSGTVVTASLTDDSDPQLSITDATGSLYPNSPNDLTGIAAIITAANQDDFVNTHTYDIEVKFSINEQTGIRTVTVLVNGWEVKRDEYGI